MTGDLLFKMYFVQYPDLLKNLISEVLGVNIEDMKDFTINNPEIPPDMIGKKFCVLDINLTVNGQRITLEVQVDDQKDYNVRTLYYWARVFSSTLPKRGKYNDLPRVVIISILDFPLFKGNDYHSEYLLMEKNNHTLLTDKMSLHYYELPKIKGAIDKSNNLELWLRLFYAKTEEDIKKIEKLGVPIMKEAISAYRQVSKSEKYQELQRMNQKIRNDEASALGHAKDEGRIEGIKEGIEKGLEKGLKEGLEKGKKERAKLEMLLAEKDAEIARLSKKKMID